MSDPRTYSHVAVLMGGLSSEREISLLSGRAASSALAERGYQVTDIDVGRDVAEQLRNAAPDVALIALHGRYGEDGTIQGVLEFLKIPYTGSGVLASAAANDKLMTKTLLSTAGIPTPEFAEVTRGAVQVSVPFPLVVKPNVGGSSIGIQAVKDAGDLPAALKDAFSEDGRGYVEASISGREITVSVVGGEALPIVEIVPPAGLFSYDAKYTDAGTRYIVPAKLPDKVAKKATEVSLATYRTLGCAGAARVDLMLDDALNPWVLEINTIPGMTRTSLLPKAASAAGLSFPDLMERMLEGAIQP